MAVRRRHQLWRVRSWIFPRDPAFAAKAGLVLGLYARTFDGESLSDYDYVVSVDDKISIQARIAGTAARRAPPPAPHRVRNTRGGALQYLAAWMSTAPRSSAAASPRPGSSPSAGSSPRS